LSIKPSLKLRNCVGRGDKENKVDYAKILLRQDLITHAGKGLFPEIVSHDTKCPMRQNVSWDTFMSGTLFEIARFCFVSPNPNKSEG
ncbi:MAG: hypothetical protein AABY74_10325, partial [Planctomycetota bacterium]